VEGDGESSEEGTKEGEGVASAFRITRSCAPRSASALFLPSTYRRRQNSPKSSGPETGSAGIRVASTACAPARREISPIASISAPP
jgi:hypothetical protein